MINSEELLFVVDEHNKPLPPKPRRETHLKKYWHRTVQVWILSTQRQILCQKRSIKKDVYPGLWEPYFGGHLNPNQEYIDSAMQEVQEELGIRIAKRDLHLFTIHQEESLKEFRGVFLTFWNADVQNIRFEKEEIDEIRWFSISDLHRLLVKNPAPEWVIPEYAKELFDKLKDM